MLMTHWCTMVIIIQMEITHIITKKKMRKRKTIQNGGARKSAIQPEQQVQQQ